ncbi:protein PRRC2C-like isoform X3 [Dermacentor silvarum]|uniref:protein PRRC2C-like isoform X3 n=1 Tax=Dermacentor silvarum TaxID=543639 RepID=UPI00189798EA|nr:protein PRRC2C-like isoform X3 [Dermacentor silvarum]
MAETAMAEIGQVEFTDSKCVDPQAPRSHDAMSETNCNNTAKEGFIHETNGDAAQSAIGEGMKDQNSGSGKELAHVTYAVLEASPGDIAPSTVEKTSEVSTRETSLSAPADTEASITDVAESSCEAAGPESCKNIQEESIQSSQEEVRKGCVETDADYCAEQKPLLSVDQGSDGLSSKHRAKSVEVQDLILSSPNNTDHPEQERSTEFSKESNPDVERATDPAKNKAIHTQVPVTDSAISGDASSKDKSESSFALVAHVEETTLTGNKKVEVASTKVAKLSHEQLKDVPVSCSSPAVPPNSSSVEVASSQPSASTSCPVVASSKQDQVLDSMVGSKSLCEVECSDFGHNSEDGVCVDDGEGSNAVSTAGEAVASTDLEGGQEATADSLDSPGRKDIGSDDEDSDEELELIPRLNRDGLDSDSGINEGIRGLEDDELEDGLDDEEEDEDCLKGERQQGDGQESVDPSDVQDKVLDFDEDKRNPQYIPKKGAFYQHDDRMVGDEDASEVPEEKNEDDKGARRQKKLWHDEGVWGHDMYREEEQGPKTSDELVSIYGYDIRTETMPPRARRRRRYGRGPNKYQRNWEDEEAYTPRSGSGRGGGLRGGRRTRGGGHIGNPPFRDEDFPDLNSKPSNSENSAAVQVERTEVKPPARPTGFRSPSSPGSSSSQQEEWDHTVKGSGMAHRGWGKRPSQPSRRVPDTPPRQQDSEVKENASSGHRTNRPAPRSPVKANEVPAISPPAGKSRAAWHLLTEHERSKKDFETLEKFAAKVELQDGDAADLKRSTTATVAPRGGPVVSTESAAKPRRYSSLRQRPLVEAAPYAETAVVAPQLPNTQAPLPAPNQPQPAILTAAHFQGPYAPYPDGYMLPPGQAPAVMPTPSQPPPPPVMAPPAPLTSSFLPPPAGIVSFPPQYPPPYTFPTQYAAPAPAAAPPTQTQAQKPPYYHGDIIYYNTQSQQHKQRPTPPRRPKAAIPIVPPPDSQGTVQAAAEKESLNVPVVSHPVETTAASQPDAAKTLQKVTAAHYIDYATLAAAEEEPLNVPVVSHPVEMTAASQPDAVKTRQKVTAAHYSDYATLVRDLQYPEPIVKEHNRQPIKQTYLSNDVRATDNLNTSRYNSCLQKPESFSQENVPKTDSLVTPLDNCEKKKVVTTRRWSTLRCSLCQQTLPWPT